MKVFQFSSLSTLIEDMEGFASENRGVTIVSADEPQRRMVAFEERGLQVRWEIYITNIASSCEHDSPLRKLVSTAGGRSKVARDCSSFSPPLLRLSRYEVLASDEYVV